MSASTERSQLWIWSVCGLLLLASTINYMDRQTLSNISERITTEFQMSNEQYGYLELAFGLAFAAGATIFGVISDRTSVRWLYPAVLLLWSAMGFLTGLVETYLSLLLCRLFLGLFEAGHWPCALKTTQRLLPPNRRTLGNSVLQSGTAIGAILVPRVMKAMLTPEAGSWRPAFQLIGALGVVWVVMWFIIVRAKTWGSESTSQGSDSSNSSTVALKNEHGESDATFFDALFSRKFLVLLIMVVAINACWHLFRVWLPKFLIKGRNYPEESMFEINFWFNIMTDAGCLFMGFLTAYLCQRGLSVHKSRCVVFTLCSLMVAVGGLIPWVTDQGPLLLAVLFVVGAGALGLFPCYYSLSQDLTRTHQGKITGLLGTVAWVTTSPLHPLFGRWIDKTGSFDMGMALACLTPLIALVALLTLWPSDVEPSVS